MMMSSGGYDVPRMSILAAETLTMFLDSVYFQQWMMCPYITISVFNHHIHSNYISPETMMSFVDWRSTRRDEVVLEVQCVCSKS